MASDTRRPRLAKTLLHVFNTGVFLAGVLPPGLGDWICRRGADVAFVLAGSRREITAENMARVVRKAPDDPAVQRLVQESFRNYGSYMFETVRYSHMTTQQMLDRVTLHDLQHLQNAVDRGKGVIFVSAHFGSMELGAVTVANVIAPMTIAGTPLQPPELMEKLIRQRAATGVHLSVYDRSAKDVLLALKRNETVGFLVDLGPTWEGNGKVMVEFFGEQTPFPSGIALLALRTGAAIVPGYAVTKPKGTVDAFAMPAIVAESTGDKEADAQRVMQGVAKALEAFISEYPEQWYMFRPMWPSHMPDRAPSGSGAAINRPA